ncbi:MAG: FKBP-type peptidyl-prolyl cis-trans isomerase [Phycisphaeraceae bacterium]|nr:MAG: FKBP-type peptidyl-prolyl cis-trans isomerase [Phycisphaeraceae bacterium]
MTLKTSGVIALALAAGAAALVGALQPDPQNQSNPQGKNQPDAKPDVRELIQPAFVPPTPKPVPNLPVVKKTELEDGLIVEDMKIGEGYEVKPGGAVVAHYHGTLKSTPEKAFDSSFERGEPIAFPLSGVIMGWQKGVPGMKVGGIRRLTIPSKLGYGERGAGADIPPNSDLVFVIELVDALQIEDVKAGEGEAVDGPCVAVTAYTIKDKDGKEIEKATSDKPYIWIPGEFQPIQFGLEGMKVGGKRRLTVPKEMNMTPPQLMSTRPQEVPITIDVELLVVRNLQPKR